MIAHSRKHPTESSVGQQRILLYQLIGDTNRVWTENQIHTVSEIKKRKTFVSGMRTFKVFNLTTWRLISDIFQRADHATKCNVPHGYHQKLAKGLIIKCITQQRAFIDCIMGDEKAGGLTK